MEKRILFMCELVEMRAGGRYIKVAGIKKEYIQNIIESIHICSAIDKVDRKSVV